MSLIDELAYGYPFVALIGGFIALGWSADRFVAASAAAAKNLGVSKVVIGLTAVSIGTSAPEIMIGVSDCLEDDGGPIAIGNAIGSNIANIGLVLGITALVRPLPFAPPVLKRELPWLIYTTLLALVCLFNLYLGTFDGLVLLVGLALILYRLATVSKSGLSDALESDLEDFPDMGTMKSAAWFVIGLAILLASSHMLVVAAGEIAQRFQVSNMVIGLTVVAVGTSLPELSVTVTAARQGHVDMAIGNVVGSNILNILAVLAIPALMAPQEISPVVLWRNYGMMMALTALLVLFAYGIGSRKVITRFEGTVLLAAWIGFTYLNYHPS